MSRTTAVAPAAYATGGAVHQDGALKLYRCNTCGAEVVWAKSARTGRAYLVDVATGSMGQRFYIKASSHTCQSAPVASLASQQMAQEDRGRRQVELKAMLDAGEITADVYQANMLELYV